MPVPMLFPARVLLFLLCSLCALATQAQVERFIAGTHYRELPESQELRDLRGRTGAVPVTEIFWYGCPSCYALDPLLEHWVQRQGDEVDFARIPAIWNPITRQHARVFYAEQALGVYQQLHTPVFDSIHQHREYLTDEDAVAALFSKHGVKEEDFRAAFNSFAVDTSLRKAETLARVLALPGVPALVIDGRYMVNVNDAVPNHATMLEVAEFLLHR